MGEGKRNKKEGREKGIEEGEYKVAIKMFKKGGGYTPEIMDLTGVSEEALREAIAKGQGE